MAWQPIETAPIGKAVLTQHEDDLYPVPAYRLLPGDQWLRETEGPEDSFYPAGRHDPLYRSPTHWQWLPESPLVEAERKLADRVARLGLR